MFRGGRVAKRVTFWTEIRNNADHGQWDKVDEAEVDEMCKGVTRFLAEDIG